MRVVNRKGLAAGLAAALALFGSARAQGSRGDTGGPSPTGADRGTGSSTPSTEPSGGEPGSSSDSGGRAGSTTSGTGSSAQASTKGAHGLQDKLERLHAVNQGEIQLGQLGAQSGQSPDVKQFAQKMETDHRRADQQLTTAAQSAGFASLEGKTFQKESGHATKEMQSLQSKSGEAFDKAFMDGMVKGHEKAVKTAQSAAQAAKSANQTELAASLGEARTMIQGHLDQAKQIQKSLGGGGHALSSTPSGSLGGTGSSGSRGDTGGPPPGGASGPGSNTGSTPSGGAPGTSSDAGNGK